MKPGFWKWELNRIWALLIQEGQLEIYDVWPQTPSNNLNPSAGGADIYNKQKFCFLKRWSTPRAIPRVLWLMAELTFLLDLMRPCGSVPITDIHYIILDKPSASSNNKSTFLITSHDKAHHYIHPAACSRHPTYAWKEGPCEGRCSSYAFRFRRFPRQSWQLNPFWLLLRRILCRAAVTDERRDRQGGRGGRRWCLVTAQVVVDSPLCRSGWVR